MLLVFALLGLGRRAALGQSSEPRLFIDDNGDICSDTVEVVQKLEYDEQVHCKVRVFFHHKAKVAVLYKRKWMGGFWCLASFSAFRDGRI